jgi:hypothetical protein
MMKTLISPFVGIAAAGLVLSLLVHVTAIAGIASPLGKAAWGLHVGIFAVWIPAVMVSQAQTRDAKRTDFWRVALRGCPPWMRYMTYGFFGYAFVNFALFFLGTFGERQDELATLRGFSGHWMAFYSTAMAILYSYLKADTAVPRCINGHAAGVTAQYCETCGQPVRRSQQ